MKFSLGGLLIGLSEEMDRMLRLEPIFELLPAFTVPEQRKNVEQWIDRMRKRSDRYPAGCRLNGPDIEALFNARASDSGRGLIDPDFCQQPHSNSKRLNRNAAAWRSLWKTDKFRAA